MVFYYVEYDIGSSINIDGVIKMYSYEDDGITPYILKEYFDGKPLDQIIKIRQIGLNEFLEIAVRLVKTIGEIQKAM